MTNRGGRPPHHRRAKLVLLTPRGKAAYDAVFMKRRPGFISTQLHRAVGESPAYLNYAVWESTAHFRQAFTNPEFQSKLARYPPSAVASPHLFRKIAVPDICVA